MHAAIASSLTVSQLESGIQEPEDLPGALVGTISESTSEAYLRARRAKINDYDSPADALAALEKGDVQAAVYDEPVLRYLINNESTALLNVLPQTFEPQNYAIALPEGSPHHENINRILLERISEKSWQDSLYRYLGE